jgi:hypothetical protein
MSRLLHYSSAPIAEAYSCEQGGLGARRDKPSGLWVSVEGDNDWRSWCEAESFGNPSEQLCYEVELDPAANVLRLGSVSALLRFAKQYECDPYFGRLTTVMSRHGVAWEAVAEKYDGIIAPYQWSLRLDDRVSWYYGWDCASGCIWNAGAIAALKLHRSGQECAA